jgi:hypothetical protein
LFIESFIAAGECQSDDLAELLFYADRVDYFDDGVVSRDFIVRDIQKYVIRWPKRRCWIGHVTLMEVRYGKKDWTELVTGAMPIAVDRLHDIDWTREQFLTRWFVRLRSGGELPMLPSPSQVALKPMLSAI